MFNEERRIRKCLERSLEYCIAQDWDFEIIVVEDGCTDQSVKIVKEFSDHDQRINLVSLPKRFGKGGSVLRAIDYCTKSNIGFMDVDLSADPWEFERLIPFIEKNDIVVGSRTMRGSLGVATRPMKRRLLSFMYHLFFSCLFDIKIRDLQCGFKLFKKNSLSRVISEIKVNGFAFDTEFLVLSKLNGLQIKEVPIVWHHDKNSKLNLCATVLNMSSDLLNIWLKVFRTQLHENSSDRVKFVARPIILFQALSYNPFAKRSLKTDVLTG
jgi:dolichyl-phosphate beta-glucosyltransferase